METIHPGCSWGEGLNTEGQRALKASDWAAEFGSDLGKQTMTKTQDYRRMLEEGHAETDTFQGQGRTSRTEYLSDHIFNFTTCEGEYSELFAKKGLEVCAAISDGKTFEYIAEPEGRLWYLLMVNMPFFSDKLEWGTSIRGAWWGEPPSKKIGFSSCGLFLDGKQLHEPMEFTLDQWREFIAAVVAYGLEEPNTTAETRQTAQKGSP